MNLSKSAALAATVIALVFTVFPHAHQLVQAQETVLFLDEFDGTSVDWTKWGDPSNSNGTITVSGGVLTLSSGTVDGGGMSLLSHELFTIDPAYTLILETRFRVSYPDGGFVILWGDSGYASGGFSHSPNQNPSVGVGSGGQGSGIDLPHIDSTQWHSYRMEASATAVNFYVDDVLEYTQTDYIPVGIPLHVFTSRVSRGVNQQMWVDYISLTSVPTVNGCYADAPASVYQTETIPLTLRCENITANVFGFQAGHTITAGDTLVTAQATSYTAGTIFQGQPIIEASNTLDLYAISLQAGGTEGTGDFTLGSVDYSADFPGDVTFDITNLILGDINGDAIASAQAAISDVTVTIIDLILSLSGQVAPEGHIEHTALNLWFDPPVEHDPPVINPDLSFIITNIKGQPTSLLADGPGHVTCSEPLTFPQDAGDETLLDPLALHAGDVNSDDAVDIADATAIGQQYGSPAFGELDINGDGTINILDLIHVGRNYNLTGPTDCSP